MRVLITGGAGLVGSHAAEYYARQGAEVIAFDNLLRPQLFGCDKKCVGYNWDYLKQYKNITRVIGDVRSEEDLAQVAGDVDVLIHTAAQPGVPSSFRMPREDFAINAYGTFNVLETLRRYSPQAAFIYCSTNKVYGENTERYGLREDTGRYGFRDTSAIDETLPVDHTGHTPYGASKYVGDIYAQEYARIYGMRTAVFRMSCIYGPRQFGFEEQGWVSWFVIAALLNKPITIYGDGKQVRDLLYVDDLIAAFDAFIKSEIKHAVFNIGGGENNSISLLEFLHLLKSELACEMRVSFADWRMSDQKVYISNINRIKEELNWQPRIPIKEGVRRLIQWAEQNKSLF